MTPTQERERTQAIKDQLEWFRHFPGASGLAEAMLLAKLFAPRRICFKNGDAYVFTPTETAS